jgi:hypothetical protein
MPVDRLWRNGTVPSNSEPLPPPATTPLGLLKLYHPLGPCSRMTGMPLRSVKRSCGQFFTAASNAACPTVTLAVAAIAQRTVLTLWRPQFDAVIHIGDVEKVRIGHLAEEGVHPPIRSAQAPPIPRVSARKRSSRPSVWSWTSSGSAVMVLAQLRRPMWLPTGRQINSAHRRLPQSVRVPFAIHGRNEDSVCHRLTGRAGL